MFNFSSPGVSGSDDSNNIEGNVLFVNILHPDAITNDTSLSRADALGRPDKPFSVPQAAYNVAQSNDTIVVFGDVSNHTLTYSFFKPVHLHLENGSWVTNGRCITLNNFVGTIIRVSMKNYTIRSTGFSEAIYGIGDGCYINITGISRALIEHTGVNVSLSKAIYVRKLYANNVLFRSNVGTAVELGNTGGVADSSRLTNCVILSNATSRPAMKLSVSARGIMQNSSVVGVGFGLQTSSAAFRFDKCFFKATNNWAVYDNANATQGSYNECTAYSINNNAIRLTSFSNNFTWLGGVIKGGGVGSPHVIFINNLYRTLSASTTFKNVVFFNSGTGGEIFNGFFSASDDPGAKILVYKCTLNQSISTQSFVTSNPTKFDIQDSIENTSLQDTFLVDPNSEFIGI